MMRLTFVRRDAAIDPGDLDASDASDIGRRCVDIYPGDQQGHVERVGKLDRGDDARVGSAREGGHGLCVERWIGRYGAVGAGNKARKVPACDQEPGRDEDDHDADQCLHGVSS